jgi:hypothetical protein
MIQTPRHLLSLPFSGRQRFLVTTIAALVSSLFLLPLAALPAQQAEEDIPDITGKYHFLTADDTLALLEEEGTLKGYIDVYQGEEESDAILSYPITLGSRKDNHVEFKTAKIHQKYYRFSGVVERGKGHEEDDPDYLRLVGDLEVISAKDESGEEVTETLRVVFKSMGQVEEEEE